MDVLLIPASANHTLSVERINRKGNPELNPNKKRLTEAGKRKGVLEMKGLYLVRRQDY